MHFKFVLIFKTDVAVIIFNQFVGLATNEYVLFENISGCKLKVRLRV